MNVGYPEWIEHVVRLLRACYRQGAQTTSLFAFWSWLSLIALAAAPPQFKDYPVTTIFRGTPTAPMLSSRLARRYRTQLRNSVQYGPNFAGHYTVARWGCGAGCTTIAIMDALSGEVWFAPFVIEDAQVDSSNYCNRTSDFELDSELFMATGRVNGRIGTHYFLWRQSKFSTVFFEPAKCP
jgi:hypothetical protein